MGSPPKQRKPRPPPPSSSTTLHGAVMRSRVIGMATRQVVLREAVEGRSGARQYEQTQKLPALTSPRRKWQSPVVGEASHRPRPPPWRNPHGEHSTWQPREPQRRAWLRATETTTIVLRPELPPIVSWLTHHTQPVLSKWDAQCADELNAYYERKRLESYHATETKTRVTIEEPEEAEVEEEVAQSASFRRAAADMSAARKAQRRARISREIDYVVSAEDEVVAATYAIRSSVDAPERFRDVTALRAVLLHDDDRGGVPIRLVRARWLLDEARAERNYTFRVDRRQSIEASAFASVAMIERLLLEVLVASDALHAAATRNEMTFPGMVAIS